MNVKLLTEHHLEFLSLAGDCTVSSESTLVKMSHCWKSHAAAHMVITVAHNFFYKTYVMIFLKFLCKKCTFIYLSSSNDNNSSSWVVPCTYFYNIEC